MIGMTLTTVVMCNCGYDCFQQEMSVTDIQGKTMKRRDTEEVVIVHNSVGQSKPLGIPSRCSFERPSCNMLTVPFCYCKLVNVSMSSLVRNQSCKKVYVFWECNVIFTVEVNSRS